MADNKKRRGRGEGGVRHREDKGRWGGTVSLGHDGQGRRVRETVYAKTKGELLAEMDRVRAEAKTGVIIAGGGRITVRDLMALWLESCEESLAPATFEARESNARVHVVPRLGGLRVGDLTSLHVERFYRQMRKDGVGRVAMRSAAVVLDGLLAYAIAGKRLAASPADGVKKPSVPNRDPLFLTAAQAGRLLLLAAASGSPCHCLLSVALGTGCRQGELLALTWDALDLDAGRTLSVRRSLTWTKAGGFLVKEPKTTASRRTIALPDFVVSVLAAHRAAQLKAGLIAAPVFCTSSGGFLFRRNVLRSLRAVIERVNDPHKPRQGGRPKKKDVTAAAATTTTARERLQLVPDGLRFHDLRHSHASILLSAGESLRAVSQRLGHADPAMTLRVYGHCMPGDDVRLASAVGRLIIG